MKAPPFRLWIGVMIFFTTFTNYMLRANMSVSIIKMTGKKNETHNPYCLEEQGIQRPFTNTTEKKIDWSEQEKGHILMAYFVGYLIALIPAGYLSEHIGPWHCIMWSSLISAILTGLTPISITIVDDSLVGVIINRAVVGVFGGLPYPAANTLIAKWAPPKEKGKFLAAMMGNTLGTVFSFNIVGQVSQHYGWEWGFYVLVIFMGIFCIFFFIFAADEPSKSRWISQEEKDYILHCQEGLISKKKAVAPYLKMITSVPFLVLCVAQFGSLWGLNLSMTYTTIYLADTLGFNLKASAGLAALPYVARLICSMGFGLIGDYLRKKDVMSITKLRKFFIIFSHILPALFLMLISAARCNYILAIIFLIISLGFNGAVVVSNLINPQDLAPNFAASCFAIMNFIGMTTGIIVPELSGALDETYEKHLEGGMWNYMIGGIVTCACGVLFILFGSGNVQPWNEIVEKKNVEEGQTSNA